MERVFSKLGPEGELLGMDPALRAAYPKPPNALLVPETLGSQKEEPRSCPGVPPSKSSQRRPALLPVA